MRAIRVSRAHYPVTVLGPGTRVGIWVQGCSIGCAGCVALDTWDADGGTAVAVEDVVARCRAWATDGPLDGITISGGEPFDQPESLLGLLDGLREWRDEERLELDLLAYSGYREARLRARHRDILERLDAVISEPYLRAKAPGGLWRGSANQRIIPLSPLGEVRYAAVPDEAPNAPAVQLVVDDGIWIIGVPRPGDMERVEAALRNDEILVGTPSWR